MQPEIQYGAQSGQLTLAQNKVLRNTYMLLALTMVPTVIGALVGMATGGIIMQHPIMMSLVMIAGVIGLQFAIAANRDSGLGVVLLLGMTFILGWRIGPLLNIALSFRNGPQLIGIAAAGPRGLLLAMSAITTTTNQDFTFIGKILFGGILLLLLAMLATIL